MRVLLLNQFYLPDISPTAQLAGSLAEHRADHGDDVTVICGSSQYVAIHDGRQPNGKVKIIRLWTPGFSKDHFLGRICDFVVFWLSALLTVVFLRRQDVVICMTTPPMVHLIAFAHKLIHRRTKIILWVMDCYPEVLVMSGLIQAKSGFARLLRWLNRLVLNRCSAIVCLDSAMQQVMNRYLFPLSQVKNVIIPNWERLEDYPPRQQVAPWAGMSQLVPSGHAVVLYLGNAGSGHTFDRFLQLASAVQQEPIHFLFVGGGSGWKELQRGVDRLQLKNIVFHSYVSKAELIHLLASCHYALVTLRDNAKGLVSPSKIHAYCAMGLPILYFGPAETNVAKAIDTYHVGLAVQQVNVQPAVDFLQRCKPGTQVYQQYAQACRMAFEERYCDTIALKCFDELIDTI